MSAGSGKASAALLKRQFPSKISCWLNVKLSSPILVRLAERRHVDVSQPCAGAAGHVTTRVWQLSLCLCDWGASWSLNSVEAAAGASASAKPFSWSPWRLGNVELFKSSSATAEFTFDVGIIVMREKNGCSPPPPTDLLPKWQSLNVVFFTLLSLLLLFGTAALMAVKHFRLFFAVFLIFFMERWAKRGRPFFIWGRKWRLHKK